MTSPPDSNSSLTSDVYRLLVNRVRPYLTARRGRWFTQNLTLTPPLIEAAINGSVPLGIAALSGTGTAKWLCIDQDTDEGMLALGLLAKQMAEETGAVLFEYSRRGAHLFVFHHPVPWEQSNAYGMMLAENAGLTTFDVFPRHGGFNAIRLPGTRHPKDGKIYRPVDPITGEELSLGDALSQITPLTLPPLEVEQAPAVSRPDKPDSSADFERLVDALSTITTVTVYAPNKAKAVCPWHDDTSPSLLIKGGRFHCARQDCVWGDASDCIRWITHGIRPPTH